MGQIVPEAVERYLRRLNHASDPLLDEVAARGAAERLPLVDAEVGAFLRVMVTALGAKRILEVGTAIGYSALWMARALPTDGYLITMEKDPARAEIASSYFDRAGVASRVHVLVGDAALKIVKVAGPFDLIFQDGHKPHYNTLLDALVARLRPGGLLITDNVLWDGEVVPGWVTTPQHRPDDTAAIAAYNERLAAHPQLLTTIVPLRDGLAVSVKRS